ncbi:MAG: heavy metal translocating P-type ATPase [Pseudomonadota bacterium]
MSSCFHCGLPNPAAAPQALSAKSPARYHALVLGETRAFCCPGCVAVAESIVASGLSSYYQERDSASPTAALPEALEDLLRYDHPAAQSDFVHREGRYACTELSLENVSCAACAWLIERRLSQEGSVAQASVNLSNHRLRLVWDDSQRPLSSLLTALESIGYRARPFRADTHAAQLKSEARTQLIRVALAGLGTMQAMMYGLGLYIGAFQGISDEYRDYLRWISGLVATPVFFYAGWPFYRAALNALKARSLTMDVPVSIALIFAYTASWFATVTQSGETYFDSVCMFIFFLQTSRYLELKARQHAGETAASLMTLEPRLALRRQADGQWETVASDDLLPGDVILIAAGEAIPCDARVVAGSGSVSEALITGEPLPVAKIPGADLLGGSVNGEQALQAEVTRVGQESVLATLQQLLARALSEKPLIAQKADSMAHFFVARVLVLAAVTYVGWQFVDPDQAFWAVLAVLVATCPCALSLATPAALTAATHTLAREGFLLTRGHVLDSLAAATHVVFDKTGTLTTAELAVSDLRLFALPRTEVLTLLTGLEAGSAHPIAQAIVQLAAQEGTTEHGVVPTSFAQPPEQVPGSGVSAQDADYDYRLGHARFACDSSAEAGESALTLYLTRQHRDAPMAARETLARITLEDQIRPEAAPVIEALRERGLVTWLMSGDQSAVPQHVAEALGIDHCQGGMTPQDKQQAIEKLQADGAVVVMVGDGVNDAPGLGQAHLGIAMGSGTDLAQTSADAVLLGDRLPALVPAFRMAERTAGIIKQNLRWAVGYNLAILPPAALGFVPPWLAALGMSLSSLVVVINALRLRQRQ